MKRLLVLCMFVCSTQASVYDVTIDVLKEIESMSAEEHGTVIKRYKGELEEQLINGASINEVSDNGWSAISEVVKSAHVEVLEVLLSHGAAVDIQDANGFTPMMCLVKNWIVVEGTICYFLRFEPTRSECANPEKCIGLLLAAGAESLELALLEVEHLEAHIAERQEEDQYEGFQKLVMKFKRLDPRNLMANAYRRIKMRRLRRDT